LLDHVWLPHLDRLQHRQVVHQSQGLDRGYGYLAPSARSFVWLGDHCRNLVAANQRLQNDLAKVRRAHENDAIHCRLLPAQKPRVFR
jgi:hypothetical protein